MVDARLNENEKLMPLTLTAANRFLWQWHWPSIKSLSFIYFPLSSQHILTSLIVNIAKRGSICAEQECAVP